MFDMIRRMAHNRRARSPLDTAIELDVEDGLVREQIVNELEQSLYRLSNQKYTAIAEEMIQEDQSSHMRNMEEMHVVKTIEKLSSVYSEEWQKAIINHPPHAHQDSAKPTAEEAITSNELRANPIPRNLNNWRKRVHIERDENATLLDRLYARKAKLRRERREVNQMVDMIVQIFDENRRQQQQSPGTVDASE